MDDARTKESKYVAAGYAIFALMNLAMVGIFFGAIGWHGLEQAAQDLEIVGSTLLYMLGFFVMNSLLALGSWRLLTFSYLKRTIFLGASITVAIAFVVTAISDWSRWYQGTLPPDFGLVAVVSRTLGALAYGLYAYILAKVISISKKRLDAAPR